MKSSQSIVIDRLQQAQNAHDVDALVACFAPNVQTEHPVHPDRAFQGSEQIRKNWTTMFHDIPDFHSELLRSAVEGDTILAEWYWFGTRRDAAPFGMRGAIVFGIPADRIEWVRLYMEPSAVDR